MAEQYTGGTYTQFVYGPDGRKLAWMNGQTLNRGRPDLPGGGKAVYSSGPTLIRYWHADWQGSARVGTNTDRTMSYDGALAPYGETYGGSPLTFTGQMGDTLGDIYNFLYREYHYIQGRWLSPDPAGSGAANAANPQTWDRYGYVVNSPLVFIDPLGLQGCPPGTQSIGPGQCESYYTGADLLALVGPGWDEFGLMDIATTPTKVNVVLAVYPEGYYDMMANWQTPSMFAVPYYGNIGALGLASYIDMQSTTTQAPAPQKWQTPDDKIRAFLGSHVCGGGVFGYAGYVPPGTEAFVGALGEYDSKAGGSVSFLVEVGTPKLSIGGSANPSGVQFPLLFVPVSPWAGGVVFTSGVGFYVGTPRVGVGAYANVSVEPGC